MLPYSVKDLTFIEPIADKKAKSKVVKEISNAWKDATVIDSKGWLWVRQDKLHSILRIRKNNVGYILMQIPDEFKISIANSTYIRGYKVLEVIAKSIEEDGIGTKGIYLETSRKYYDSINLCDKVKLLRLEYDSGLKEQRKKLKKRRIKKYDIKVDELTNEVLKRGCEFSHIKSVTMYKYISDNIDNGLIVNKETHNLITSRGVNDEDELRDLCEEQNWNIDWYDKYIENLENII